MPTPNITYFLGAGASANSLPVMNLLEGRLDEFHSFLQRCIQDSKFAATPTANPNLRIDEDKKELADSLYSHTAWLRSEIAKHQTVDTLARKLYLNSAKDDQLRRLKSIMTIFFLFEQSVPLITWGRKEKKELVDKRYDSFIAAIINPKRNNFSMPKNVKIITWNYDLQFESAYKEYNTILIPDIQDNLQIIPNLSTNKEGTIYDLNKFLMIRLNGVIGLKSFSEMGESAKDCYLDRLQSEFNINYLLSIYKEIGLSHIPAKYENPLSYYNYNWEYDKQETNIAYEGFEKVRTFAREIMSTTNVLVIIGYSFPIFNREADSELMRNLPPMVKIYIQDSDFESIKERITPLLSSRGMAQNIHHIKYITQFYFPDELSPDY